MCDFCKKCSGCSEECVCFDFLIQPRTAVEIAKDMAEVLLQRQEACNAFILAAAKALEDNSEDAADIISGTTALVVELAEVDQTIMDLMEYIDEVEGCCCDDCFCYGCPYADECGGDCFFDDEDFFAPKEEKEEKE